MSREGLWGAKKQVGDDVGLQRVTRLSRMMNALWQQNCMQTRNQSRKLQLPLPQAWRETKQFSRVDIKDFTNLALITNLY